VTPAFVPRHGVAAAGSIFHRRWGGVWIFVDGSAAQKDWLKQQGHSRDRNACPENDSLALARLGPRTSLASRPSPGKACCRCSKWNSIRGFQPCRRYTCAPSPTGRTEGSPWARLKRRRATSVDRWVFRGPCLRTRIVRRIRRVRRSCRSCIAPGALAGFAQRMRATTARVGDTIPLPDNEGVWRALDSPTSQKGTGCDWQRSSGHASAWYDSPGRRNDDKKVLRP